MIRDKFRKQPDSVEIFNLHVNPESIYFISSRDEEHNQQWNSSQSSPKTCTRVIKPFG